MRINKRRHVYLEWDWWKSGSRDEGSCCGSYMERNQNERQDNVSGVAQAKDLIESQHPLLITRRTEGSVEDREEVIEKVVRGSRTGREGRW